MSRSDLAALQRELFAVRTALVDTAAAVDAERHAGAVERLDELVDRVHALLKRS